MTASFVAVAEDGREVARVGAQQRASEEQALLILLAVAMSKSEYRHQRLDLFVQWPDTTVCLARVDEGRIQWELGESSPT
jgi:hypothetical protein